MADIITPPAASQNGSPATKKHLKHTLDDLLERYLDLVETYEKSRGKLTGAFMNGFMNIAEANQKSFNRIRYGQDYYDGRMQAALMMEIDQPDSSTIPKVSPLAAPTSLTAESPKVVRDAQPDASETGLAKSSSSTSLYKTISNSLSSSPPGDPINWFGIFVPVPLRAAQVNFRVSTADIIPSLVNVNFEMLKVESEIKALREEISKL